jgi:hypothetical protein
MDLTTIATSEELDGYKGLSPEEADAMCVSAKLLCRAKLAMSVPYRTRPILLFAYQERFATIYAYVIGGHRFYTTYYDSHASTTIRNPDGHFSSEEELLALSQTCQQTHSKSAIVLFSLNTSASRST